MNNILVQTITLNNDQCVHKTYTKQKPKFLQHVY